jgi:hypothetical protein
MRITERELRRIIRESVRQYISESAQPDLDAELNEMLASAKPGTYIQMTEDFKGYEMGQFWPLQTGYPDPNLGDHISGRKFVYGFRQGQETPIVSPKYFRVVKIDGNGVITKLPDYTDPALHPWESEPVRGTPPPRGTRGPADPRATDSLIYKDRMGGY